jgi:hypothetical protein
MWLVERKKNGHQQRGGRTVFSTIWRRYTNAPHAPPGAAQAAINRNFYVNTQYSCVFSSKNG